MKNSFVLYTDYKQHIDLLSTEEKAQLLDAIFGYAEGHEVELEGAAKMAFSFIKAQMDRDHEKYEEICEKRREAGAKGGAPKGNKNAFKQNNQMDSKTTKNNQVQAKQPDTDTDNDNDTDTVTDTDTEKINYSLIVSMYNDTCVSFPKCTKLSDRRKKAIRARLRSYGPDDFKRLFELAEQSDFLKGGNKRNWSANFDWLIQDANMAKVLDGNYSGRSPNSKIEIDSNFRNFIEQNQVIDWDVGG